MEVFKSCKVRQYANAKRERQGSWYCKKPERTFFASAAFWSKHGERGREKVEEELGGEGDPDVGGSEGVGGGEKEGANSKEEDRSGGGVGKGGSEKRIDARGEPHFPKNEKKKTACRPEEVGSPDSNEANCYGFVTQEWSNNFACW